MRKHMTSGREMQRCWRIVQLVKRANIAGQLPLFHVIACLKPAVKQPGHRCIDIIGDGPRFNINGRRCLRYILADNAGMNKTAFHPGNGVRHLNRVGAPTTTKFSRDHRHASI